MKNPYLQIKGPKQMGKCFNFVFNGDMLAIQIEKVFKIRLGLRF